MARELNPDCRIFSHHAHAYSHIKVELGGVMLGQSFTDDAERPFVVISDCLRAQHYKRRADRSSSPTKHGALSGGSSIVVGPN